MTFMFWLSWFGIKGNFVVLVPLTAELYPTKIRTLAMGIATSFGGLAAMLMPIIVECLNKINKYNVFIVFGGLCIFSFCCCLSLPFDTTGKSLDHH